MAYKSSFIGTFDRESENASSSKSGSYTSPFTGTFAAKRKRKEDEEANRNYAEELHKEQETKAKEAEKKKQDAKSFGEKTGDVLGGIGNFVKDAVVDVKDKAVDAVTGIGDVLQGNASARDELNKTKDLNKKNKEITDQINAIVGDSSDKKAWDDPKVKKLVNQQNKNNLEAGVGAGLTKQQIKDSGYNSEKTKEAKESTKENRRQMKESQEVDATKTAAAAAETFLNVATLGIGKSLVKQGVKTGAKALGKEVAETGIKGGSKAVITAVRGAGAKKVLGEAGKSSLYGAGFGATNTAYQQGDEAELGDYTKNILLGAAIGAAIPVGIKGVSKIGQATDSAAGKAVAKLGETNIAKENEAMQRALKQIGEDGVMGTVNKSLARGIQKVGYSTEDALAKSKIGTKALDLKDDFMSKWVTEFHPLYGALKRSDFEGKTTGAYLAAREAIGNSNRSLSYAQDFIESNPRMQKITASLSARDKDLVKSRQAFDEFSKVKSDLDLATNGQKKFSAKKTAELNDRMSKFKDKGFDDEYKELTGYYQDLNDFRLENGLISKDQHQLFKDSPFDYVRQQREIPQWMKDKPAGKGGGSSASITGSGAIQKRNKFADQELLSPMETAIKTTQQAHVEAYRNKAAKTVYGLLDEAGEARLLKTTDMVREKQALLTGMKEGKIVANKINKALTSNKVQARDLKKEIQWLQRDGKTKLSKNIKEAFKDLETKRAGSTTSVMSEKQMMDTLVSLETPDLRKLRKMIEGRNSKLEPLLDRIEALNNDLGYVQAQRSGMWNQANSIKTNVNKSNQTTMSFLDDGVENVVKIDPNIASAIHNWDKQSQNVLGEVLRFSNNVFKYGTTGANAGFAIPNFIADQVESSVNSKALFSTHNPKNFTHALFMAMGKPLNKRDATILAGYLKGNKGQVSINQYTKASGADKAANTLIRKGGAPTTEALTTKFGKLNAAEIIKATKLSGAKIYTNIRHPKEGMRALFDATEGLVAVSENVTRIQNYRGITNKAQRAGRSAGDTTRLANQAARENSVDFLEMGSYGRVVNTFIPYFNAAIQGNRTILRNAAERPVSFAAKTAAVLQVPVAASTIWNTSDPNRKAIYDTIPEYVKENNHIIVGPNAKWNEDKKRWDGVFIMKKPPGIKELAEPTRKLIEYKANSPDSTLGDFLKDEGGSIAADFASSVQPIDFSSPGKFLSSVTPQILKPTAEAILNKNFFQDSEIVGDWMQDKDPKDQKYEHYSQLSTHIAAIFNTSPLKVDHWIKATFGEVGTNAQHYIDRSTGAPEEAQGGRSLPKSIERRFYGAQGGADTTAFYESYQPASSARKNTSSRITELVKAGRLNEAKRRANDYNESIKGKFSGFMKKYSDSPNYDPKWDERINDLYIPTTNQAFKARAKQK